jgi:putative redox protein
MPVRESLSVSAIWEGGYRCRVTARAFEIRVDEPLEAGGDDTGPQPTELFLASLASCFALALAHVAGKRQIMLDHLSVRAVGRYYGPGFNELRLEVEADNPRDELADLAERAAAVCYVSNTLRAVDAVQVVIVPPEAGAAAGPSGDPHRH